MRSGKHIAFLPRSTVLRTWEKRRGRLIGTSFKCVTRSTLCLGAAVSELCRGNSSTAAKTLLGGGLVLAIGTVAGTAAIGASAVVGGSIFKQWLDDSGKYRILKLATHVDGDECSAVLVSNCLSDRVTLRLSKNKHTAIGTETKVLVEKDVEGMTDARLKLPHGRRRRLALSVTIPGVFFGNPIMARKVRPGQRYLVCEVDDDVRALILGRCPLGHMMLSADPQMSTSQWTCDGCARLSIFLGSDERFRCKKCDYSMCNACFDGKTRGPLNMPNLPNEARISLNMPNPPN